MRLLKAGIGTLNVSMVCFICAKMVMDYHGFPMNYRKNSLFTESVISKVSEIEKAERPMVVESVNAIRLTGLTNLLPGWNKLNDDVWALRSNSPCCADTTLCPAETLMRLRTTLAK